MVVVWILLVVALVVTLGLCGLLLVRKGITLLQTLADFLSLPAILDGVHRADPEPRPEPAVLGSPAAYSAARGERRARSRERRLDRRNARVIRGRALIAANPKR